MKPINVVKSDIEQTCFCCPVPTRLVIIEQIANFPICETCLFKLSAVEVITADYERRLTRHELN